MSNEIKKNILNKTKVYLVKCTIRETESVYYNASQKTKQNCMILTPNPQDADHFVHRKDAQDICDHFKKVDTKKGFNYEVEEIVGFV